jgi:RNA polymerase sigma-70 factor (ECF subfamily)
MVAAAPPMTDEELVAQALGPGTGSRQAMGELLARHTASLHRFFTLQFRDPALAEDLVQGVFERVIQARKRFRPGGLFRPWLWAIARNVAADARRRHRAAPKTASLDESDFLDGPALGDQVADSSPSPRHRLTERERSERLWDAIEGLEDDLRDVLLLKHFEELPSREVAAILDVPEGTVWSRMHRALVRLREILEPDLDLKGGGPA